MGAIELKSGMMIPMNNACSIAYVLGIGLASISLSPPNKKAKSPYRVGTVSIKPVRTAGMTNIKL